MTQEAAVRETELPGFLQNKQFFSTKRLFLHSKKFFLQSKINFFSQGKKCQVEGCSCTYCLPDKKMERLVIGICPTQNSLSGQIDNCSFFFRDIEIPSNISNANLQALYYRVSQKNPNRMLLETQYKDTTTIKHLLCMEIIFLGVS